MAAKVGEGDEERRRETEKKRQGKQRRREGRFEERDKGGGRKIKGEMVK